MIKLKVLYHDLYQVDIGNMTIMFSFETPIALFTPSISVMSNNIWSRKTGRHINIIKESYYDYEQIPNELFMEILINISGGIDEIIK